MADTVLVVEDEREIRDLLRRYLERAGFAARTTPSGAEAIRVLGDGGIDLVVLDLGLPDIDGLDVLAAAGGVPTVVLTARDSVEDRIRGLQHGADDYVTKPFSPTELVLGVQAVLHRLHGGATTTMAAAPGRVFSRYELVNRVRGYEFAGYERTIDSHVKNLRRKLATDPGEIIATVLGVGYRLVLGRDR